MFRKQFLNFLILSLLFFLVCPSVSHGENKTASLYVSPASGTFLTGSTFSVSIFLNTKGNEINAIELNLKFPTQILQVTTPTSGESFISEWLTPPSYSNTDGTILFKGGIPEGIVTSAGLVSTITFRTKSAGKAKLEILDSSQVLLKDGKGTPMSVQKIEGIYQINIPAPEGPVVESSTHPDSTTWYPFSNPVFYWEKEPGVTDFSYSLSQNPMETPDTASEGDQTMKSYENIPDGVWYFHLRAKRNGEWGRTSHFEIKIDVTPPMEFDPGVDAYNGFIYFETKDSQSGIDRFDISIFEDFPGQSPFFIEATSPYKIPLEKSGKYAVIVRAYDRAGNYREAERKFQLISSFLSYEQGKGISIKGFLLNWWVIYIILFCLVGAILYLIFYLRNRTGLRRGIKEIGEALEEIKKIEEKEQKNRELEEKFKLEKNKLEERIK